MNAEPAFQRRGWSYAQDQQSQRWKQLGEKNVLGLDEFHFRFSVQVAL
jgi:hypothetical protein